MVDATKSQRAQHNSEKYTADDLIKLVKDMESKQSGKTATFQIKVATKKIGNSLALFEAGKATVESTRKGLEGLKELSILTRNNEKTVSVLVDNFNATFLGSGGDASEVDAGSHTTSVGNRKKPSKLKRYIATGALGLTLLSTPVKSFAQRPATYSQSQSVNMNKGTQTEANRHYSEIEEYKKAQQKYYDEYQEKVEQNIKYIMGKNLPSAQAASIVNIDFENIKKLRSIQGKQMNQLLDVLAKERQELANQEIEEMQQRREVEVRNREPVQNTIREQKILQEEAIKRVRTQQMINTGMTILGETLWLAHR